jgi:hypothetical protein
MRKYRKYKSCVGAVSIASGAALIMSLVLPSDFWFFLAGALLIMCGVFACRRR